MLTQITQNAADSIPNLTDAARCSSTKTPGRKTLRAFAVGTGLVFIVGELGYRQPQNAIFGLRCNEFCRPFVLRREEMSPIQPRDKKKEMSQLGDIADPELDYGNGGPSANPNPGPCHLYFQILIVPCLLNTQLTAPVVDTCFAGIPTPRRNRVGVPVAWQHLRLSEPQPNCGLCT